MSPPFLTLDPRTSPFHLSPHLTPESPNSSDSDYTDSISPLTPSPVGQNQPYRLSGFTGFNFNLSSISPAGAEAHPENASTAGLVPPIPPRASPPPPLIIPQQAAPAIVQSNALPGGVHREAHADIVSGEPAPPPYERYNRRSMPIGGVRASRASIAAHQLPTDPSIPAAAHSRGQHPQRLVSNPRRFSGQRQVYPLALSGDLARGQSQRKASWRIFGAEESLGGGEKRRKISKNTKWIIGIIGATVLISVIVLGVLFGTMKNSNSDKGAAGSSVPPFDVAAFPVLPTGVVVISPQGPAETPSAACVQPETLWSCALPTDSKFPSNSSGLPEFIFTIALRNSTNSKTGTWEPVPALVPNDTDYAAVAGEDGIVADNKVGELTQFYLSMQTDERRPITIASTSPSSSEDSSDHEKRQAPSSETAQMLPATLRNQQLRLFDRGLDTEHYGFFVHYKKTINVLAATPEEVTNFTIASDSPSGVSAGVSGAKQVTWENTRLRVVIWTKQRTGGYKDLVGEQGERYPTTPRSTDTFFPYVVSVFEDRAGEKGPVYSMEEGSLVKNTIKEEETDPKGCFCEWRNWVDGN
ncbi:hypothetical protein DFP73DRAFT_538512 [Morchella snyderi]|nr:hypothetical protein DFP73DRAFT_538512 [Morchella snyderi]